MVSLTPRNCRSAPTIVIHSPPTAMPTIIMAGMHDQRRSMRHEVGGKAPPSTRREYATFATDDHHSDSGRQGHAQRGEQQWRGMDHACCARRIGCRTRREHDRVNVQRIDARDNKTNNPNSTSEMISATKEMTIASINGGGTIDFARNTSVGRVSVMARYRHRGNCFRIEIKAATCRGHAQASMLAPMPGAARDLQACHAI